MTLDTHASLRPTSQWLAMVILSALMVSTGYGDSFANSPRQPWDQGLATDAPYQAQTLPPPTEPWGEGGVFGSPAMDAYNACECGDCGCGCCGNGCAGGCCPLFGIVQPSDHCFDDFISPMINFVFFEDPRTVTELRPIFVNHWVPDVIGSGIPAGGDIQLYALQFRLALSERLSLIAVKDGYIVDGTEGALDGLLSDGWAAVTAGLKYNLVRDPCSGTIGSVGLTYEVPIGSQRALQDIGDGEFHLFFTGGQRYLQGNAHWLTSIGYRQAVDDEVQNSAIHWSNHLDLHLGNGFYLFTEATWWHWTDDADTGLPLGVAGQDLFNLSSTNVVGNDLLTQSLGVKLKTQPNQEIGIAYEFPLTDFKDVIDSRLMVDLILRF